MSDSYEVWLPHWTDLPDFLTLAKWVKEAFEQEAIAIKVARVPDII